ncbi:MAG: MaoC family dehydratase [Thermoanaerobaculia bacterium]
MTGGVSDWIVVSQERINQFADATGDHQWIHVDTARGPTIAHGFLTLSLMSTLLRDTVSMPGSRAVNYGLNRVRFIAPVPAGSRIRGRFVPASVEESEESTKVVWNATIEREGGEKPCCVAEWIVVYYR